MASEPDEDGWRGLHPASIVVNLVPRAWRVLRQSWPLLLALVYGSTTDAVGLMDLSIVLLFFGMTVASSVVHFLTLRYRVQEGRLEIETGLLNRQVRTIDPARIQNVELSRNVFHRMSGLVEVRLETASGREVEGLLSALSVDDAESLVASLEQARRRVAPPVEVAPDAPAIIETSAWDLFRYGGTSLRVGTVLVMLAIGFEALSIVGQDEERFVSKYLRASALPLLLGAGWLIGVGSALFRHWGFTLRAGERGLVAEEGLFTRRVVELRPDKVQVVSVVEPWLRRLLGFGSVQIETAAASGEGGTRVAEAMVPVVARDRLAEVVTGILPVPVALDAELRPPHPHALRRALIGSAIRSSVLAGVVTWLLWPWGLLALLLVPLALTLSWLDFRHQGWLVTPDAVIVRAGWLSRTTRVMPRHKLQSLEVAQGPLLRRYGLGIVELNAAGTAVALPALLWDEGRELVDQLSRPTPLPVSPPPAPAAEAAPSPPPPPPEP